MQRSVILLIYYTAVQYNNTRTPASKQIAIRSTVFKPKRSFNYASEQLRRPPGRKKLFYTLKKKKKTVAPSRSPLLLFYF